MPIYEFKCQECGERFEELLLPLQMQKMNKKRSNPLCPYCCSHKTKKQISAANGVVKGFNEKNGYSKVGG